MEYQLNTDGKTRLFFPKEFFRGEFRCDFFVSTNMKHYWAAQLEVLAEIDRICRKYDIQYFADSGTLLGAVRHKGFIPWDDDVDIAMLREDYNRFVAVCAKELDDKYVFLRTFESAYGMKSNQYFARVVHNLELKNKKYSLDYYFDTPFLAGIDIFPLDYMSRDSSEAELQIELTALIDLVCQCNDNLGDEKNDFIEKSVEKIERLANITLDRSKNIEIQLGILMDNICQLYNEEESDELTIFPVPKQIPGWRFRKEWYKGIVLMDFEFFKIPCPIGYENILKAGYGDYAVFKRGEALHNYPVYTKYKIDYRNDWENYLKESLGEELSSFLRIPKECIDVKKMLKYGVRNTTMQLDIENAEYTFRIPGNKIRNLANYNNEARIYEYLKEYDITDSLVYHSVNNGSKLAGMVPNAHYMNTDDREEVSDFLEVLAFVHKVDTSAEVSFDIWEYIEEYEELWSDSSFFNDYENTKKKIRECYDYTQSQSKVIGITHFDLSGDNVLISEYGNSERDIRIIDWEFAGIQDTHIDIAVFALNASYSREEVDWLIDSYIGNQCQNNIRIKIYCYIAVCALLFSNYYEYIDRNGEDMTQEQAAYYKKALEYYELFNYLVNGIN